ncbi:hypothetical protein [Martelella mediterranea]|nr:hypothetical protein [Martelella mediterranea]
MLKQAQISEALLRAVSLKQVAETHFPIGKGNKAHKEASRRFHELVEENRSFEALLKKSPNEVFSWFVEHRPKDVEALVRQLSRHQVLGHYFLEKISEEEDGSATGYVCLLREVITLPRSVAERLGRGLDQGTYQSICAGEVFENGLCIQKNDLAMPVVEIGSPTIEHILQSFAQLFGRIGVADPVEDVIGGIVEHCISSDR